MAQMNPANGGRTDEEYTSEEDPNTPQWAAALLRVPGIEVVRDRADDLVDVETTMEVDEDGVAEPEPEMMTILDRRNAWEIVQSAAVIGDTEVKLRTTLRDSEPNYTWDVRCHALNCSETQLAEDLPYGEAEEVYRDHECDNGLITLEKHDRQ